MDLIHVELQMEVKMVGQARFFDLSDRVEALSAAGDPLEKLSAVVIFDVFLWPAGLRTWMLCASPGRKAAIRTILLKNSA